MTTLSAAGSDAPVVDLGPDIRLVPVLEWPADLPRPASGKPFPHDGSLLAIDSLSDADLLACARDAGPERDDTVTLGGGFVLVDGATPIIEPSCCADLSDRFRWEEAASSRDAAWTERWIGHPCMMSRYEAGQVWLNAYREPDTWPLVPEPGSRTVRLPADTLAAAVTSATALLEPRAAALEHALAAEIPDPAWRRVWVRALLSLPDE